MRGSREISLVPSLQSVYRSSDNDDIIWKLTYRDGIKRKGDKIGMVSVVSSKMRMFCRAVRRQIVRHLTTDRCWRLLENYRSTDDTIEEYVQRTHMARNGVWGTNIEMLAFCNLAGVNIASYNEQH